MAEKKKYKAKVPDVSDFIQNIETTYSSKLKFSEKYAEKLTLANKAIVKLRIFSA